MNLSQSAMNTQKCLVKSDMNAKSARPAKLFRVLCGLIFAISILPVTLASAQQFPNFVDPSAREETPDFTLVPALRFLTSPDFPPFNFWDENKQLIGFHIDLARALCEILEAKCTIQSWPWDLAADALNDNQGDAFIGGMAINQENVERFDFTDIYLQFPARLVARQKDFKPTTTTTWKSAHIAVRKDSSHEKYLARYLKDANITSYATEIEALKALNAGEVDIFFGDGMRAAFWMNEKADCCLFVGDPFFDTEFFGLGLAIAVPRDLDSVRLALNWALAKLSRQGTVEEFYLRWFPVNFY